jgi:hypothetical protein
MEHAPNARQACCGPPAQADATAHVSCAATRPARNIWKKNPARPTEAAVIHRTAAQITHQGIMASPNQRDITAQAGKAAAVVERGLL